MSLAYANIGRQAIIHKSTTQYHRQFTELALCNATIDQAIYLLASIIKRPILLLNQSKAIIASTESQFPTLLSAPKTVKQLNTYTNLPVEQELFSFKTDVKNYDELFTTVSSNHISPLFHLSIKDDKTSFCLLDWLAIEACITAISLIYSKNLAIQETERKLRSTVINSIIKELLSNSYDLNELNERACSVDWDPNKGHIFVVITFKEEHPQSAHIHTLIGSYLSNYTYYQLQPNTPSSILLLIKIASANQDILENQFKNIQTCITQEYSKAIINIGVSSKAYSLSALRKIYYEAHNALSFGKLNATTSSMTLYDNLGIYRFLCPYSSVEELMTMVPAPLLNLYNYDQQRKASLIKTLSIYFKHNSNAKRTANELFIHYKTVQYRINRAREIMGIDFEDYEHRLNIEMGLRILPLVIKKS